MRFVDFHCGDCESLSTALVISVVVALSVKLWEIRLRLLLGRKSHTGFRFVPIMMTLNDLHRRNATLSHYLTL